MKSQSVATFNRYVLIITSIIITAMSSSSSSSTTNKEASFIGCACRTIPNIMYPQVCNSMLNKYAYATKNSLGRTTQLTVHISEKRARNLHIYVTRLSKEVIPCSKIVKSCKGHIGDAIDSIEETANQMKNLTAGPDLQFKLSSLNIWMSAAFSNLDNCKDEAAAMYNKDDANGEDAQLALVLDGTSNLTRVISTSLSFINAYVDRTWNPAAECSG